MPIIDPFDTAPAIVDPFELRTTPDVVPATTPVKGSWEKAYDNSILSGLVGVAEGAATAVSGLGSFPIAVAHGLSQALKDLGAGNPQKAFETYISARDEMSQKLTYKPMTQGGQITGDVLNFPFAIAGTAIDEATQGDPAKKMAFDLLMLAGMKGKGKAEGIKGEMPVPTEAEMIAREIAPLTDESLAKITSKVQGTLNISKRMDIPAVEVWNNYDIYMDNLEKQGLAPKVEEMVKSGEKAQNAYEAEKAEVQVAPETPTGKGPSEGAAPIKSQVEFIRDVIDAAQGPIKVKDAEGMTVSRLGSGYPEWFQNKGYTQKEVLNITDKAIAGKELTAKQQGILNDLIESSRSDYEKVGQQEIKLDYMKPGDSFVINGEKFKHMGFDDEGNAIIRDHITYKIDPFEQAQSVKVDEFIPAPEESVLQNQTVKEAPKKATPQDMFGFGNALEGKIIKKTGTAELTPLEQAIENQKQRDAMKKQQELIGRENASEDTGIKTKIIDEYNNGDLSPSDIAEKNNMPIDDVLKILEDETGAIDVAKLNEGKIKVQDYLSIDAVPKMERIAPEAANAAVEHANAKIAAPHVVDSWLAKIFPDSYRDTAFMNKVRDILNKDNILDGYDAFIERAEKATEPTEVVKWVQMAADISNHHDLAKYDAEVRSAIADPKINSAIDKYKKVVNPEMDRLYNEMKRIDPNTPQEGRGKYTGARVNLLTEEKAAQWNDIMKDSLKPIPEANASNYRNPNVKHDQFDRAAKFTGQYSDDMRLGLLNALAPRMNEVTKIRMYDAMVKSGIAAEVKPGTTSIPDNFARMSIKVPETAESGRTRMVEKSLIVRKELVNEIRNALGTDQRTPTIPGAKILTKFQIAQIADLVTHTKNIITNILHSQTGSFGADLVRKGFLPANIGHSITKLVTKSMEVIADTPAIREQIATMSKQGLIRPEFPAEKWNALSWGQQFLHKADTAARMIMNDRFNEMASAGMLKDTIENRRRFVNQVGQYNRRLMGPIMQSMRDNGIAPFIVAGRTYNKMGRRYLTGSYGAEAASSAQGARMRAMNIFGTVMTAATLPMILNSITTGTVTGRDGTPLGAWDLGMDKDEHGKHKVIDLLQITGLRRGMRTVGLNALIEGLRQDQDSNAIMGRMAEEAGNSALHPWLGPGIGFVAKTLTGRQLDMRGYMSAEHIKEGGIKQNIENARAAVESQNPLLYEIGKKIAGVASGDDNAEVGKVFMKSPYGAFGVRDVMSEAETKVYRKYNRKLKKLEKLGRK